MSLACVDWKTTPANLTAEALRWGIEGNPCL